MGLALVRDLRELREPSNEDEVAAFETDVLAGFVACISDGTPMAWIDWDAVIAALDSGHLPSSSGEQRIVRVAASLAAGHPVSLRDAIPGLDQRSLHLVTTAIRHAAGQRQ